MTKIIEASARFRRIGAFKLTREMEDHAYELLGQSRQTQDIVRQRALRRILGLPQEESGGLPDIQGAG